MAERKRRAFSLKKPKKRTVIILLAAVVIAGGGAFALGQKSKKNDDAENQAVVDIVTRGDLEVSITGEASVEPYERYEIISMVSGDILSSPYDVGDTVSEGDILYRFDTSDMETTLKKQEISLKQSENSYRDALSESDKLSIYAPCSGVVSNITLKNGDDVNANQSVADITDSVNLEVTVPFTLSQVNSIYNGQEATVSSSVHMSTVSGTVTHISSTSAAQSDGSALYDVTIAFKNPGAFTEGTKLSAEINGMVSPGYGEVKYSSSKNVKTETDGTITQLAVANGDYVNKGDLIATLQSDSIEKSITNSTLSYDNAKLSMQQTRDGLEDYSITAPISGTIITKNAKAGDTIDRTNSTQTLMVVADISKLKFSLEIDELDVSKVTEGQKVSITCDALPNESFVGEITTVSVEGTATNGVTTYTAEVIINEPGNLRPSMNIDASVIVDSASDVILVPTGDVKTVMGKSYVFVKDDSADGSESKKQSTDGKPGRGDMPEDMKDGMPDSPNGEVPEGMRGERPEGADGEKPEGMPEDAANGERPEGMPEAAADGERHGKGGSMMPEAPEGFRTVEVTLGISNDDYTEIKSGLSEGQQIYQITTTTTSSGNMAFGGIGGGMPGGGMGGGMSGGGGGGMPGGGGGGGMPGGR